VPSDLLDGAHESLRAGLGLGGHAGDRDLLEAVALGEMAEGGMAGDDRAPGAARETRLELGVELAQAPPEPACLRGPGENLADPPRHRLVFDGVEPDVWVVAALDLPQEVESRSARAFRGFLQGGLEA
jgi:hypothetical protein